MERADWLDGGLDAAAARFLMMTAITYDEFSSPSWGEDEVRKLHAELAELDRLAAQAVVTTPSPSLIRGGDDPCPRGGKLFSALGVSDGRGDELSEVR
jgi:hypothetical protein